MGKLDEVVKSPYFVMPDPGSSSGQAPDQVRGDGDERTEVGFDGVAVLSGKFKFL
jgi:hypothetical protein